VQEVELVAPTKDVGSSPRRPTLTRTAAILWGAGMVIFLGSVIAAVITTANAKAPANEYAGFSLIAFPYVAAIAWMPLGIASLILVIIALARRERGRGWAIALLALNAISLPCVLAASYWVLYLR
jgi:uncharacterized membrane protein YraQ (UPF0718 family)